ncbi:MAG TPA: hypothetical protein GX525_11105 [Bacilli bacterium]|nr:hypothetical protein [Bacilli bacterium]
MFNLLRPYATSQDLLEKGTDLHFKGRFQRTLEYNHFTQEDYLKLEEVSKLLADSFDEASSILLGYFKELQVGDEREIPESLLKEYLRTFFNDERDEKYVDKIIAFFCELRNRNYNIGKLIVAFNQLNFFFSIKLLSKKALTPNACLRLMETLQRGMNIVSIYFN